MFAVVVTETTTALVKFSVNKYGVDVVMVVGVGEVVMVVNAKKVFKDVKVVVYVINSTSSELCTSLALFSGT